MSDFQLQDKYFISPEETDLQREYIEKTAELLAGKFPLEKPKAFVHTYGCQGNVSDGERIKGILEKIGYVFTDSPENADFVLYNTCAIREHAEDRVFGNLGALKPLKKINRNLKIALCGCMMQQKHVAERIYKSFPYVNLVFGTHVLYKLPELMYRMLSSGKRVYDITESDGNIAEGISVHRDKSFKAFIPIMYGCNNFCTYCIVPYVRGRERSRRFDDIVNEASCLVKQGYKELTLLGQNVNSYKGSSPEYGEGFPALLRAINAIEGDFIIRFMTSHPKDCTKELINTIYSCKKVARHLHLPVQSGNDEILKAMNRKYDRAGYLSIVEYAQNLIPDLSLTSDIIVGFPGETDEQFKDTLSLVDKVGYTSLFTFIFSPRKGTAAYKMADETTPEEKGRRFKALTDLQEQKAALRTKDMLGKTYRVLCEEPAKREGYICGRTEGNVIIEFPADKDIIGSFINVKVTDARTWVVDGEPV